MIFVPNIVVFKKNDYVGDIMIRSFCDTDFKNYGYLSNFATGSLKFPFLLKMAIFVNLEVPFFIWNKKNQCAARGSFGQEYHPPTPPPSTQWRN